MHPILGLAKNIIASNAGELSAPYKLTYALTYRCQLKCSMCNIWKREPLAELTHEEIAEFFRNANRFSWINLSGGEIFLRNDLPRIFASIAASCKQLYLLNFPTNGYLTDVVADTVARVVRDRLFPKVLVTVSLDGPPDVHDRIRNTPGSWERAVATYDRLRTLRSRRFNVYFGATLHDGNADAFEEMVQTVQARIGKVQYGDFHVNVLHTSEHYYANSGCGLLLNKERVIGRLHEIEALRNRGGLDPVQYLERRYQDLATDYLRTNKTPVPCQALGASLFMDPTGMVYPCTMYDRPIGTIRDFEYRLEELWRSEKKRSARTDIRAGNCPHCWTPCEAYQSLLADMLPRAARRRT